VPLPCEAAPTGVKAFLQCEVDSVQYIERQQDDTRKNSGSSFNSAQWRQRQQYTRGSVTAMQHKQSWC